MIIPAEAAGALARPAACEIVRAGATVRASSSFEPKVGGGGHLVLRHEQQVDTWARVVVEPDGSVMNLVAAILDAGDWEPSDETLAAEVRAWLKQLFGC